MGAINGGYITPMISCKVVNTRCNAGNSIGNTLGTQNLHANHILTDGTLSADGIPCLIVIIQPTEVGIQLTEGILTLQRGNNGTDPVTDNGAEFSLCHGGSGFS